MNDIVCTYDVVNSCKNNHTSGWNVKAGHEVDEAKEVIARLVDCVQACLASANPQGSSIAA